MMNAAFPNAQRMHYEGAASSSTGGGHRTMTNEAIILPKISADDQVAQRDVEEISNANVTNMVLWRGNLMAEKEAMALRHVFDDMQDHFGHQRADPRVRFNANLVRPSRDGMWFGDLDFTYNINGEHCNLGYIGMDVCVDLCPKLVHKHGQLRLKNYGKSWVYVYLPQLTLDKFKSYVKTGTGWDVSNEGTVYDPNRNLVAIEAMLHHQPGQPKPSFWAVKDKDAPGDNMSFSRIGTVQEVNEHPHQQRVHRGVGIFSVSMEVEGSPNFKPTPRAGDEANLCFTLVSVRTWGVTDCVAPIVHAPNKWY
mmetsp:Transcript_22841/g.35329  ORF Transcript_22841/g.35329 Transcript_22841/m.35329 type:complete len:308 (+) Transcript_22841:67-990(+)